MIAPDLETATARLRDLIETSERVVPFTGAGISTESGIPDFRSPGGLWTKTQPIPFDQFLASREMRDEAWRRRFVMEEYFARARPTRGHLALAQLYRSGKSPGVITQNIDNLHQASGIAAEDVIELHGNTTFATCLDCSTRYELDGRESEIRFLRRPRARLRLRRLYQDRDRVLRSGDAGRRDAARAKLGRRLRSFHRDRFLAGGLAGRGISAAGEEERRAARHRQSRSRPSSIRIADLVIRNDIGDALAPLIVH